jgi:hypothetical protein
MTESTTGKIRPSESAGTGQRLHVATVENGAEQLVPQTAPGPDADRQPNGHPKAPDSGLPDYSQYKAIKIVPDHLCKEGSLRNEEVPASQAYGSPGDGERLQAQVHIPLKGEGRVGRPVINRLAASHDVGSRTYYQQAPQPAPEAATSVAENSRLGKRLDKIEQAIQGLLEAQQAQPSVAKKTAAAKATKTEADQ